VVQNAEEEQQKKRGSMKTMKWTKAKSSWKLSRKEVGKGGIGAKSGGGWRRLYAWLILNWVPNWGMFWPKNWHQSVEEGTH
jgi:hypothetical protein